MMWLNNLMIELDFRQPRHMPMHYDNQLFLRILCFMRGLSTLRLTIIWSEMVGPRKLFLIRSHHPQSN